MQIGELIAYRFIMENAAAMLEAGNTSPATLAPKVETTSVFKSFWPGRKASNVALNLEGESTMLFKFRSIMLC